MSRGLGRQQRGILAALRRLERQRGPGWRSPAEVIATLCETAGVSFAPAVEFDPYERIEAAQIAQCQQMVAMRHREFAGSVVLLEARIAERAAAKVRRAARRAPNLIRPVPRAGEDCNPSRVLALLTARGLVERNGRQGPAARVRLVAVAE